jgi:fructose-bisphosphate aldolase, class II
MAVVRAAESKRSPAIIQLFPWTLHFQGPYFIEYVLKYAHSASVPIAVHLDHCIKPSDVDLALSLNSPFDSIMVDASILSPEENIVVCKSYVERAKMKGICIEAEMGRMEGGEDGLPHVHMETILTTPEAAETFVRETGVHFLAPSFGNIHGPYGPGGAEKAWDLPRLKKIGEALSPDTPLALHGTHPVSDELFLKAVECGVRKINLNRTVRDRYTEFVTENAGKLELTVLKMEGVEIYTKGIERMMDVLASTGKA